MSVALVGQHHPCRRVIAGIFPTADLLVNAGDAVGSLAAEFGGRYLIAGAS